MECIFLDLPSYLRRNVLPLDVCLIGQVCVLELLAVTRGPEIANILIEHLESRQNGTLVLRKEGPQRLYKQLARSAMLGV